MDIPELEPERRSRPWRPRTVLITRSAQQLAHGKAMADRARALGIAVTELPGDRLSLAMPDDPRRAYAEAKNTLAIVVAPPSKLKLQPIAPSADWRVDLAEGCPAHCSYCYLAGSLKGPPITRAFANIEDILQVLPHYLGTGTVTSRSLRRAAEGTTFEASCYTDPLALEHITGSLSALIARFGRWEADVQLRFTTKFAAVEPLLGIDHGGRTRMRVSLNPAPFARFEGGTAPVAERLKAMRRMADAGYRIGLTIAPIIAVDGWEQAYPDVQVEVIADDGFVDMVASGCDAGIRYDERLEQDMIAVPIGPRVQRFATAAAPAYLDAHGRPGHPRDLLAHACLRGRFTSGALTSPWEFERDGEVVRIEPQGPLIASVAGAADLLVDVAIAGGGVISLFEDWLRPAIDRGALEPVLPEWWQAFSGPFLYYSGRRLVPSPLRALLDFLRDHSKGISG